MARRDRKTPEELALIKAQTQALAQQSTQAAEDTQAKREIAYRQMQADREINTSKLGLGREEIGSREKQARQAAALELLGQKTKSDIAREGERGAFQTELVKVPGLDEGTRAAALAESGQPSLYNARARKEAEGRDTAINQLLPAIVSARDDAARHKILDPLGSNAFDVGVARGFPKPENESVRGPIKPKLFEGTTAPTTTSGGVELAGLMKTLLGGESSTDNTEPTAFGRAIKYAPEVSYTGLGHGSLEGSTPVAGGIQTPSGGFIGGTLGPDRLAKLINPRGTVENVAAAPVTNETEIPSVPVLPQQSLGLDRLVAGGPPNAAAPTPTAAPLIAPTGTPVPQATPQITPDALALAELIRRKQQQPVGAGY